MCDQQGVQARRRAKYMDSVQSVYLLHGPGRVPQAYRPQPPGSSFTAAFQSWRLRSLAAKEGGEGIVSWQAAMAAAGEEWSE